MLAPAALGTTSAPPLPIGAIVFPEYAPSATPALTRLDPGRAGYSLLAALLNARNLPALGVPEAGRFGTAAPAYWMRYRLPAEALALLETLVR